MSTTHPPTPDPVEDRLRAALVAEADRHPVTPDLEGLRARGDRTVIDLTLPPRRNRARILAAAVVLAVLAAGVGAAISRVGDEGEPVTSGPAVPSGYYLPGPGWEVVAIEASPTIDRFPLREAVFTDASRAPDSPRLTVDVIRGEATDDVRTAWESGAAQPVPVQAGGSAPPAWVVEAEGSNDGLPISDRRVLVPGDGEVLVLTAVNVDLAVLLDVARGWLVSDGLAVRVADDAGLQRVFDQTYPDADPLGAEDLGGIAAQGTPFDGPPATTVEVMVQVRSPSGAVALLIITPPRAQGRPTGVGDRDRGAARGVDLGPTPSSTSRRDGEVWQVLAGDDTALWALLPGADIRAQNDLSTSGVASTDDDALRDLVDGLRMVDRAEWLAAVDRWGAGPIDGVGWGEALATSDPGPAEPASETTMAEGPDEVPETTPSTTETTSTTEAASADRDGVVLRAREALQALGQGRVDPDIGAVLADEVTVGFVGDTEADVVLGGDDRLDPERWSLELGGRWAQEGPASALVRLSSSATEYDSPAPPDPDCAGGATSPLQHELMVITPIDIESCLDWFAVVVRIDDAGRIGEVRLRLWEP